MIADRAITVRGSDDPDSDFAEDESYTSVMLSRDSSTSSITSTSTTLANKLKKKINVDEDGIVPAYSLKAGSILINPQNYQFVIGVLKSLKDGKAPSLVYDFLKKILQNIDEIEFKAPSSSQIEKLKQLFFYKVFRYTSFALKTTDQNENLNTPSVKSLSDSGIVITLKEDFEKYIKESIGEHIKDVLKNPKQNLGSVGFIAGVSNCIKYLTPETVTSIVDGLEENKFLKSNNFNEIIPLCIPILENFSSKFDSRQKEKMHKICIDDAKAAKSKSKKMYLALQCLFSKDERAKDLENNTLEKFNAKAFLNNKSLAKLFIRSFIRIYYDHKDNESEKGASNELEMLIQVLTKKQKLAGSQSLKRIQIINYILTQILSYDILKQGFSSFENMKAYSLIFESFQGAKNDEEGDESTVKVQSARQINFFLKIYENSLSYLSQYSSDSLVTSLNLILSSARMSNLFSSSPKFYEYKIIDTLYYCAVVSYSQEIIDVIFNELEYIAIKLIESGQSLIPIANSIRRHMIALRLKDMKYYISVSLVNLMSKILEHFVKENYADISRERNINFMRKISTLFTPIIIPVVRSIDSVMNENITGYKDQEVIQEFKNSLATPIRNIWGCALIFKGFSEKDTEFASIFDPFEFYSIDLMQLAYFITPPLINPSKDPEYSPVVIDLLHNKLISYLSKKYKEHKVAFHNLPEDMIILLGEIEFVMSNQLVYLKNSIYDSSAKHILPTFISDVFYYLQHDDITALKDLTNIMTSIANSYLDDYFAIVLSSSNLSTFARDIVSRDM